MRIPPVTIALGLGLVAGAWTALPARADDSDIPGIRRTEAGWQRLAAENPEMKPYMTAAPQPAAAPVTVAAPTPAPGFAPARKAALGDVDALLRQAEADIAAKRLPRAEAVLARAQTALLNAQAAGEPVPPAAMAPLAEASEALRHGRAADAGRAADTAEHLIASAE